MVKLLLLKCWWRQVIEVHWRCRRSPSHQSVVGGMSLWFTEDVYEDPPAKVFGRGNVGVDAKGVEEAPRADVLTEVVSVCRRCWRRQCWCRRRRCQRSSFCWRTKRLHKNVPEMIGCIFQGLYLSIIALSNINMLAGFLTLKKTLDL